MDPLAAGEHDDDGRSRAGARRAPPSVNGTSGAAPHPRPGRGAPRAPRSAAGRSRSPRTGSAASARSPRGPRPARRDLARRAPASVARGHGRQERPGQVAVGTLGRLVEPSRMPCPRKPVSTSPGSITTTSMPNGAVSTRSTSEMASSANLLAWYGAPTGNARRPPMELMLRMRPPPRSRMPGERELDQADGAQQVRLELTPPPIQRDLLDRTVLRVSGVVDQDVEPAPLVLDGLDGVDALRLVGDVEFQRPAARLRGRRASPAAARWRRWRARLAAARAPWPVRSRWSSR